MLVFADTFYWIALLARSDEWHAPVTAFSHALVETDRLVTTDAVFTEVLAAFSAAGPHAREEAVMLVDDLLHDPQIQVVETTRALFLDGLALYRARSDKEYSLVDCMAMQIMRREGITDVLTHDRHFTQEGFRILFP